MTNKQITKRNKRNIVKIEEEQEEAAFKTILKRVYTK